MKKFPFKEMTLHQTTNGIIVREKNVENFGSKEHVFNDKKDLNDFINDNFFDAEEAAQMEDDKNKEHKES